MSDTNDALTDVYIIATGWHAGTIKTEEAKRLIRKAVEVFGSGLEPGTVVECSGGRIRYEVREGFVLRTDVASGLITSSFMTAEDVAGIVANGDARVVSEP